MTKQEVADIVDSEGLGYAITSYISGDDIDDPILREKWKEADKLLGEIQSILPEPYENDEEQV